MSLLCKINDISLYGGFASSQECSLFKKKTVGRLVRSLTVDENGGSQFHPGRVCEGMHFQKGEDPLIADLEARIADIIGVEVSFLENIQILRYTVGGKYEPHYDFFDLEALPGSFKLLEEGGQRVGTVILYLNRPDEGGETIFPLSGVSIFPVEGNLLYFQYPDMDKVSLHGGSEVTSGEKWILTTWVRQHKIFKK
ncbi:MAG: prolyl hydroxylase family protein [Cetobacterium sp.]